MGSRNGGVISDKSVTMRNVSRGSGLHTRNSRTLFQFGYTSKGASLTRLLPVQIVYFPATLADSVPPTWLLFGSI